MKIGILGTGNGGKTAIGTKSSETCHQTMMGFRPVTRPGSEAGGKWQKSTGGKGQNRERSPAPAAGVWVEITFDCTQPRELSAALRQGGRRRTCAEKLLSRCPTPPRLSLEG